MGQRQRQRQRIVSAYNALPLTLRLRTGAIAADLYTVIPNGDFSRYDAMTQDEQTKIDGQLTALCMTVAVDAPGSLIVEVVAEEFNDRQDTLRLLS